MLEHMTLQDFFWAIVYLRAAVEAVVWLIVLCVLVLWVAGMDWKRGKEGSDDSQAKS